MKLKLFWSGFQYVPHINIKGVKQQLTHTLCVKSVSTLEGTPVRSNAIQYNHKVCSAIKST